MQLAMKGTLSAFVVIELIPVSFDENREFDF